MCSVGIDHARPVFIRDKQIVPGGVNLKTRWVASRQALLRQERVWDIRHGVLGGDTYASAALMRKLVSSYNHNSNWLYMTFKYLQCHIWSVSSCQNRDATLQTLKNKLLPAGTSWLPSSKGLCAAQVSQLGDPTATTHGIAAGSPRPTEARKHVMIWYLSALSHLPLRTRVV